MATRRKRHMETSTVTHQAANLSVQVYYDRQELLFHASYAGQGYQAKTEDVVRNLVYEAILKTLDVPWQPVIHIRPLSPYMHLSNKEREEFVGFDLERIWVTKLLDAYKSCQWNGKETGHLLTWCKPFQWEEERDGAFSPPCHRVWYSDTDYYLPYSEELWEKLQYMQQKIAELRRELITLFEDQAGLDRLMTSPWLALPEPDQSEQEGVG